LGSGRAIIMAAVASLAFAAAAHAGIACLNSKPCFNTCIPYGKACHKPTTTPHPCLNSKPCDGRCIPYSQTCSTGRARQSKP
jgi:hypothetical protein